MPLPFPTFPELKDFIIKHPGATICEIRDHFHQQGEDIVSIKSPLPFGKSKKIVKCILAYGIDGAFYTHLTAFIREKYVKVEANEMACRISDATIYIGPGKFIPTILSIDE